MWTTGRPVDDRLEFVGVVDIVREGVLRARSGRTQSDPRPGNAPSERDEARPTTDDPATDDLATDDSATDDPTPTPTPSRAAPDNGLAAPDAHHATPDPDQRRPALVATVLAAILAGVYLIAPLTGQDLSAQLARADFAYAHPFTPVDLRWFGGSLQFGYSLWAPWLAGLIGTRVLGALLAVLGTWLATRLMQQAAPARPLWGGVAIAICQVANLAQGRVAYECGLVCALAAVLAILADRRPSAVVLAVLAGAASPVAALGLWVYAITAALRRRVSDAVILAVASAIGTAAVSVVFADGATMMFGRESAIRAVIASLLVIALLPRRHNAIRVGAAVNLAVVVVAWAAPSPIGSNAERLGLLFAIPVIAAFAEWRTPIAAFAGWRTPIAAFAVVVAFVAQPPATLEIVKLAGVPATHASYYNPLVTAIHDQGQLTGRVEVPEMNGHWDAALLAEHVPIARGWLRQLDTKLNDDVFFAHPPTEASYQAWLATNAVQYVAVPDARLTPWGRRERALIQGGLPYLRDVWHDRHWTLYAVEDATGIVSAPAHLVSMDAARIVLTAPRNATVRIRIRWFDWTTLNVQSGACIERSGDQVLLRTGTAQPNGFRFVISSALSDGNRGHCQ